MRPPVPSKPVLLAASSASLVAGFLLVSSFLRLGIGGGGIYSTFSSSSSSSRGVTGTQRTEDLTAAILHYATSSVTPQQSRSEIQISYNVLRRRSPCNFLVFGLGHDSLMWKSFNPGGPTVFLEEDPKWVMSVTKGAPSLTVHTVRYRTRLKQADELMDTWRSVTACSPSSSTTRTLRGNHGCKLALSDLPNDVYEREWDLIMIDAPRGYFPDAPGRMAAIYSAAVMARNRKGVGPTDVFLHDVDRRVERRFAMEFLCKKFLVEGKGRLWHFRIPANATAADDFC